jgi:hypothetical protein
MSTIVADGSSRNVGRPMGDFVGSDIAGSVPAGLGCRSVAPDFSRFWTCWPAEGTFGPTGEGSDSVVYR